MKHFFLLFNVMVLFFSVAAEDVEPDRRLHSNGHGWKFDASSRKNTENLPRVLLIGDSICAGYKNTVINNLLDRVIVDAWIHPYHLGYLRKSPNLLTEKLGEILRNSRYAVITFNIGLHGLDGRVKESEWGGLLEKLTKFLQTHAPESELFWVTITPLTLPDGRTVEERKKALPWKSGLNPERNPEIVRRNAIAAEVMKKMGVETIDIYTPAARHSELAWGDIFHWDWKMYALMGYRISKKIDDFLEEP